MFIFLFCTGQELGNTEDEIHCRCLIREHAEIGQKFGSHTRDSQQHKLDRCQLSCHVILSVLVPVLTGILLLNECLGLLYPCRSWSGAVALAWTSLAPALRAQAAARTVVSTVICQCDAQCCERHGDARRKR